ncbi:MAG: DNA polymerase, partial [Pseudomonadota bacterium]
TGADVLEDLAADGHDLPRTILDWRALSKLKSTYTDALQDAINPETGRVHTSFMMAGAQTGRLASTDPNLQNIPIRTDEGRKIREAFIAEPGNVLISADYSQIELRLLAHIAEIDTLRQAFRDGLDIHAMTASEMFGDPIEGMDPMVRRRAKAINFGIIYGISAFGLARQLSIPRDEASAYIKAYFEKFPGIRDYMDAKKEEARETGMVKTAFGRRIHLREIKAKNPAQRQFAERQAINAPLQGSSADIIKRAMVRMPKALSDAGLKARMLLQVHDELIFEAPANEADAVIALAKDVMSKAPLPAFELAVPLVVDAQAASNWAEAH